MPEHNLIQNPQLLYKLGKHLGLRQPHVVPALNEGLQAVIVLDDLTNIGTEQEFTTGTVRSGIMRVAGGSAGAGVVTGNYGWFLVNANATNTYRIRRIVADASVPVNIVFGNRDTAIAPGGGSGIYAAMDRREVPSGATNVNYAGQFLSNAVGDQAAPAPMDNTWHSVFGPSAGASHADVDFRTGFSPVLKAGNGINVQFIPPALSTFSFILGFWFDEKVNT